MNKNKYLEIYKKSNTNAWSLLESAKVLFERGHYPQSYVMAYSALEEISKSQFSADVFTNFRKEEDFASFYRDHNKKIENIMWAHNDASNRLKWIGPDLDDVIEMNPDTPLFQKRNSALYVDIDFPSEKVIEPKEKIAKKEAEDIIHIVDTAIERIWEVSNDEFGTGRIGTKAFLK